jgi:hypothetical protein
LPDGCWDVSGEAVGSKVEQAKLSHEVNVIRDRASEVVLREVEVLEIGAAIESSWELIRGHIVVRKVKGCEVVEVTDEGWDYSTYVLVHKG